MDLSPSLFDKDGYSGPYPLFASAQAKNILNLASRFPERFFPWIKGRHSVDQFVADIAKHPAIISKLQQIMGNDILLWGSQIIKQKPGKKHNWHIDFEHTVWEGVSVWVALENVQPEESISVISGSHRFNVHPAELKCEGLDQTDSQSVLEAARKLSPESELIDLDIHDGEFFIFEGKAWHGTKNSTDKDRYALLLQYCRPDQEVKALKDVSYPIVKWHSFRPDCLLVSGEDKFRVNKVIKSNKVGSLRKKIISGVWYAPQTLGYKVRKKVLGW
ncbi:phytanoyl-CoA dioxygenase family protein [Desertivirga xinjiangensis]|uniref:phytanoyl-CoA dioxygenase family protein n=1 Tax=Desertivirga xinjiangensis TaxID=539206 RepID=UPI0021094029|nr:phytanoyl-CoA dioxygenase family protein [Pedobacter xinjiangensis]